MYYGALSISMLPMCDCQFLCSVLNFLHDISISIILAALTFSRIGV